MPFTVAAGQSKRRSSLPLEISHGDLRNFCVSNVYHTREVASNLRPCRLPCSLWDCRYDIRYNTEAIHCHRRQHSL
jgi:hypothetical protein